MNSIIFSFIFAMLRLTPLFMSSTLSIMPKMPMSVRGILLIMLSFCLASGNQEHIEFKNNSMFIYACVCELVFGMAFLFAISILMGAVDMVGRMMDSHSGIASATLFNPMTENASGIIANMLYVVIAVLIWLTDTHLQLIRLYEIYLSVLPLGRAGMHFDAGYFIGYVNAVFIFAFLIFSPIFAILVAVDTVIGIVSKIMPQMNVYFVTLPIKIMTAMIILGWMLRNSGAQIKYLIQHVINFMLGL
ncbi:flagellar biosynthetic protein FliR [Pseudaeromonas pectinilytica]